MEGLYADPHFPQISRNLLDDAAGFIDLVKIPARASNILPVSTGNHDIHITTLQVSLASRLAASDPSYPVQDHASQDDRLLLANGSPNQALSSPEYSTPEASSSQARANVDSLRLRLHCSRPLAAFHRSRHRRFLHHPRARRVLNHASRPLVYLLSCEWFAGFFPFKLLPEGSIAAILPRLEHLLVLAGLLFLDSLPACRGRNLRSLAVVRVTLLDILRTHLEPVLIFRIVPIPAFRCPKGRMSSLQRI